MFIITQSTDIREIKYGYCLACLGYNETLRKKHTTKCRCCGKRLIHVSDVFVYVLSGLIVFGSVILSFV